MNGMLQIDDSSDNVWMCVSVLQMSTLLEAINV